MLKQHKNRSFLFFSEMDGLLLYSGPKIDGARKTDEVGC